MIDLPDMTVEERTSTTSHGLRPPTPASLDLAEQLGETICLNALAKRHFWPQPVFDILQKYSPVDLTDGGSDVQEVLDFASWKSLSEFVVDDLCADFFNLLLSYCMRTNKTHKDSAAGFIDGTGIGYLDKYLADLKPVLEKCFDAKWYFKQPRPLMYASTIGNMDINVVANAIHPGHWSYPAGHGTKFFTAVKTITNIFEIDKEEEKKLLRVAILAAHGRSGNLIHFPEDNVATFEWFNFNV